MKARLPWLILVVTVALLTAMFMLSLGREPLFDTLLYGLLALGGGVMGALITSRQPSHRIGWLFCALGLSGALLETWEAFAYHSLPTGWIGEWVISWTWIGDLALYAIIFLLFPTGRLLSRRWRWVIWLLVAACALAMPGQALSPDNVQSESGTNRLASDSALIPVIFVTGTLLLLGGMTAGIASLFLRYRKADGVERLQIKQILFASFVVLITMAASIPFYTESVWVQAAVALGVLALPIATGLSILRHGLYDIDLIINRTLVYVPLTALLAGVYVAMSGLLRTIFTEVTGSGSETAIALSTLTFVALLTPVKNQLQTIVDKRFREAPDPARELKRVNEQAQAFIDVANVESLLTRYVGTLRNALHARGAAIRIAGGWGDTDRRFVDGEAVVDPWLTVTLEDAGRAYGEVTFTEREDRRPYSSEDEELVKESASVIAGVLSVTGLPAESSEPLPVSGSLA